MGKQWARVTPWWGKRQRGREGEQLTLVGRSAWNGRVLWCPLTSGWYFHIFLHLHLNNTFYFKWQVVVVCLSLAHVIYIQTFCEPVIKFLVVWNQPRWENLHLGNWQRKLFLFFPPRGPVYQHTNEMRTWLDKICLKLILFSCSFVCMLDVRIYLLQNLRVRIDHWANFTI